MPSIREITDRNGHDSAYDARALDSIGEHRHGGIRFMRNRFAPIISAAVLAAIVLSSSVAPTFASSAIAVAAPLTFTDPSISLIAGQQYYPSAAGRNVSILVNQGYTREAVSIDVGNYTTNDQINIISEYSVDNWQTVIPAGGDVTIGGSVPTRLSPGGTTVRSFITAFPDIPPGSTLSQRFNLTVPSAGLLTNCSLTVS